MKKKDLVRKETKNGLFIHMPKGMYLTEQRERKFEETADYLEKTTGNKVWGVFINKNGHETVSNVSFAFSGN